MTLGYLYFFPVLDDPAVDMDDTSAARVPGSLLQESFFIFLPSPLIHPDPAPGIQIKPFF